MEIQKHTSDTAAGGVNAEKISRTLLRIVAHLSKSEYTEANSTENGRQADERQPDDLSNPASEMSTSQG